ncbi:acetolactate synthase-1/2/3 large subunit [Geodermatophilus telluris]|uniref:Acetolactate synthase-1/2/3 large subunit n=1 Tax=Geodermatophilus telluris TaxID=1190417 RepID=A0A1G6P3D5_9ACTN|nr:5-guanidino-2-oxopentanoate decarboxylase [Geodermatophilus telluris]SDC74770.1 acetolactate synthase-1/2/3 large subunit [Geodermatophilus telluris]
MTEVSGGQALVAALVAHGVDTVFGIPGTHNLEIYRHLALAGVRHVSPRHEQGAGYAADGYARVSGRPGVAVVTSGPALLNAAAAVGQAWSDSVPVLVVSPGLPLRHPGLGNGLLHETRDQGAAMAAVAAASIRATSVAEIPVAVAQAFALMTAGRPRPVHLEVPLDVLLETGPAVATRAPTPAPAVPAGADLAAAAARLAGAARPVLVVGGGARGAAGQVRRVAERLGAPTVTTTNGKGVLPEDHPLSLGAGLQLPAVRDLVADADAVLAVGTELAPSDLWYGPLPLEDRLVRVDVDPVGCVVNAVPAVALVGDAAATLDALLAALPDGDSPGSAAAERAAGWRARKDADARAEGAEWLPLLTQLAEALPREAVVGADNAMVCYYGALANLPTHRPGSFLFPTGFGTLGYGLPAAVGAKVADPGAPVVALLGDGGVMFTLPELAMAADLRLPLPVVVVDNAGYGEIRNEMRDRDDPVHAVDLPSPDLAAVGRALGCHGVTLDGPDGLADAVRRALAADRPTVVHVRHSPPTGEGAAR